jgi:ubiquitin C-terminal hydrolase
LEVDITWKCVDCGKTHVKKQSETSIHLPLSRVVKTPDGEYHEQRLRSLDACFQQEFADADGEGVACDSQACNKKKGDRIRKTKITSGPEILVIHLVRMASDLEGNTRKLKHRIEYGERLDLGEWSVGPLKYQLNGIVAHQGPNLTQGHYVSMVRCQNGADFAECNDNSILDEPREKASILEQAESKAYQSYMLVYQKIGGKMAESLDPEKKESK